MNLIISKTLPDFPEKLAGLGEMAFISGGAGIRKPEYYLRCTLLE
jgi:hypothetical protein